MDKSREQFEAYFIQYHLNDNPEMVELFLKRDGEGYKLPCPNDEWRMWQASRAAMEVEIPEVEKWRSPEAVRAQRAMLVLVKQAISDAGLNVKGE
ncbi:hypothetical protein SM110_004480 [Cronobacter sakazakii]|nr:hypothetical protein [Cronobacter sakazakii]